MNELGTCEQDMYEQGMNEQEVNGQGISELGRLENLSGDMEKNPYRPYYFENPAAYDSPIRSWEEFCGRFRTEFAAHMPKEAPTYMNPFLEESAYFFPNPKDEVALVVNCGYCPPFLHRLAFIKIVYVLRGSCFFFIGGEKILMKKGSFCLVGPNVEQAVYSCNDEDIVVNLIMRFSSFAESFLGLMWEQGIMSEFLWRMLYSRTDNGCLMYDGKEEEIITENVKDLCEEILFETQNPSSLIRKSMLMLFYGNVLRLHEKELIVLGREGRAGGYQLADMIFYMENNLTCSLPKLAGTFNLSEGYLSRYLRKETGKTFAQLLCEFRMRRAEKMLLHTDFSIEKIVETVGYTDKSRFYRNFKAMYCVSPVKYRKGRGELCPYPSN